MTLFSDDNRVNSCMTPSPPHGTRQHVESMVVDNLISHHHFWAIVSSKK